MGDHTAPDLRAANRARQVEWDQEGQITLSYRGNELAGEVGEACNVIKKLDRERMGIRGSRATKDQLAEELADVVICADLIAMDAGIDLLNDAVPSKFNATSEKVGLKTRLVVNTSPAVADLVKALEAHDEYMGKNFSEGPESSALHPDAAANWKRIRTALSRFRELEKGND